MVRPVLLALAALALAPAGAAGQQCRASCRAGFADTLRQVCGGCVDEPIRDRDDCLQLVGGVFTSCGERCPTFAGRCAITRDCLNTCREGLTARRAACLNKFQSRIRSECTSGRPCLAQARTLRRQCLQTCRRSGSSAATLARAGATGNPCSCQTSCISGIVGSCYAECKDRCEGDRMALSLCRSGCRDANCARLQNACTDGGGGGTSNYEVCCTACGNCTVDVDCEVVTTTTASTRTTTSSSSTSTTSTLRR